MAAAEKFTTIAVADIVASPHNHRRRFNGLEELGDSIVANGLVHPLIVRPKPGDRLAPGAYELVCGERRWRAAKLRGIDHLPAIVRDLSDDAVREQQLIENVQRADVHPLDEADGYRDLLDKHGYTVDQLVAKTGKSRSWVYGRLKLCELVPEVREAFLADKITTQVAIALARLPVPAHQAEALSGVLGIGGRDLSDHGIEPPLIDDENSEASPQPLTNRQALAYLERRYMLDLSLAKFPLDDRSLVPDALDCGSCTYRTGNQPDLFGEVTGDRCTRPPCFEAKTKAWFAVIASKAKADGMKVIEGKKAENMFGPYSGDKVQSDQYVEPGRPLTYDDGWTDLSKRAPTFAELLGKQLADVPRAIVQAPSGAAVEVIDRQAAVALAKAAGKIKAHKAEPKKPDDAQAAAKRRLEQRRQVVASALPRIGLAIARSYRDDKAKDAITWWRWLATRIIDLRHQTAHVAHALRIAGATPTTARKLLLDEINSSAATPEALRFVIAAALAAGEDPEGSLYSPSYHVDFAAAAKAWGVDLRAIEDETKAADKKSGKDTKTKKPAKGAKPAAKKGRAK